MLKLDISLNWIFLILKFDRQSRNYHVIGFISNYFSNFRKFSIFENFGLSHIFFYVRQIFGNFAIFLLNLKFFSIFKNFWGFLFFPISIPMAPIETKKAPIETKKAPKKRNKEGAQKVNNISWKDSRRTISTFHRSFLPFFPLKLLKTQHINKIWRKNCKIALRWI